jgi:VanZ family protein
MSIAYSRVGVPTTVTRLTSGARAWALFCPWHHNPSGSSESRRSDSAHESVGSGFGRMTGLTWFWPALVVSGIVALLLAQPVARALRCRPWLAWMLITSLGLIAAATLTPIHGPTGLDTSQLRPCDLDRRWFASLAEITTITDVSLNIAMFVPLGLAIAWLPRSRRAIPVLVLAVVLPFVIEGLQYALPTLARGCQSGDVIDNLTGLAVGLVIGVVIRWGYRLIRGRPPNDDEATESLSRSR